jgi:hypothetical protein
MQTIYTNGITNIAFQDGIVRVELITCRQVDNHQPEPGLAVATFT